MFIPEQNEEEVVTDNVATGGAHFIPQEDFSNHLNQFLYQPEMSPKVQEEQAVPITRSSTFDLENCIDDCRSVFDITSAEMHEIENELKKDFSCLDFSLLELESPS